MSRPNETTLNGHHLSPEQFNRLTRFCRTNPLLHLVHAPVVLADNRNSSSEIYNIKLSGHGEVRVRTIRLGPLSNRDDALDKYISKLSGLLKIFNTKQEKPFIHELLGLVSIGQEPLLQVISKLPANSLMEYLYSTHGERDILACIKDISKGLRYLHLRGSGIVHGDIRGDNILVKADGICCLGEFAFEFVPGEETLRDHARWIAPELVGLDLKWREVVDEYRSPGYQGEFKKQSDIFALACTIIEVYTGQPPEAQRILDDIPYERVVALQRAQSASESQFIPGHVWGLLERMLRYSPITRPDAAQVLEVLEDPTLLPFVMQSPMPVLGSLYRTRYGRRLWSVGKSL